jgi:O-antigen/teichoic acid export membrane protein
MTTNVRRSVVRALGASSAISVVTKVLSLTSTLVLVRLLTPADYGLVAIATAVTGIIGFFNEIGLGSAIVQRQSATREEINGCFGIALLASTAIVVVAVAMAWPMAGFYGMPELGPVLAVLGACLYFGALNTVPVALLRKELRFQPVLWSGTLSVVVQSAVAIPLAFAGFKHWSIVVGFVAGQASGTLLFWISSGWRPNLPMRLAAGKALMGYGLNITANRLLWHVYMNADKLIIGKLVGAHAVGVYDVARSLANLPTSQISGVATNIASPVFARLQSDTQQLGQAMLRLVRGVAYLVLPILMGMAVLAPDLVVVLAGERWIEAAWPLRALCFAEMVASVASLQAQLLISSGNATRLIRYNTLCALVLPASLALGAWQAGLMGVALVWALVYPVVYAWLLRETMRIVELPVSRFVRALFRPLSAALLLGLAVVVTSLALANWPPLVRLVAGAMTGTLTYMAYVVLADREGLAEIHQVLRDLGLSEAKLARWPFTRLRATETA